MSTVFDTAHYGPLQIICQSFSKEALPRYCTERMKLYIDKDG